MKVWCAMVQGGGKKNVILRWAGTAVHNFGSCISLRPQRELEAAEAIAPSCSWQSGSISGKSSAEKTISMPSKTLATHGDKKTWGLKIEEALWKGSGKIACHLFSGEENACLAAPCFDCLYPISYAVSKRDLYRLVSRHPVSMKFSPSKCKNAGKAEFDRFKFQSKGDFYPSQNSIQTFRSVSNFETRIPRSR